MKNLSTFLPVLKTATDIVVSSGVGAVVGNAIRMSTPLDATTVQKGLIRVGGLALSSAVASATTKHTSGQIDSTIEQLKALKSAVRPGQV